jgi:hypothetical protein
MADVNDLILHKLKKYPKAVAEVALEAVSLATHLPQRAVEEQLRDVVRRALREREAKR